MLQHLRFLKLSFIRDLCISGGSGCGVYTKVILKGPGLHRTTKLEKLITCVPQNPQAVGYQSYSVRQHRGVQRNPARV